MLLATGCDPGAHGFAGLGAGAIAQHLGCLLPGQGDVQVNTVQQRSRHPGLIAGDDLGSAAAVRLVTAQVAAGAGVHGGDQLEACRIAVPPLGAGDRDLPQFERLAQCVEHAARELGQFIEKQHTAVGQGDLAGRCQGPAANQRHCAGGMMRAAKGAVVGDWHADQIGNQVAFQYFGRLAGGQNAG